MKIKADRKEVVTAISRVIGGVEKTSTIPVLSHVLLDAGTRGTLRISASDLSVFVTTSVKVGIQGETGMVCVPADKLKSSLEKITADVISLELAETGTRLIVIGDDSRVELQVLPADEFPNQKDCSDHEVGTFPGGYVRRVLAAVGHAISADSHKYNQAGINFCIEGSNMTTVATDGHRLSVAGVNNNDYDLPRPFILPTKAAKLVASVDCNQGVYFSGDGPARFTSHRDHGTDIQASVVDGDFPDFRRVIPQHENAILVDSEKLTEALELCGVVAEGKSRMVTIDIGRDTLGVTSLSDIGVSQVDLPIQNDSEQCAVVKVNSKYLLQAIKALESDEVFIKFKNSLEPLLLVPVDNDYWDERLELVMTMRE